MFLDISTHAKYVLCRRTGSSILNDFSLFQFTAVVGCFELYFNSKAQTFLNEKYLGISNPPVISNNIVIFYNGSMYEGVIETSFFMQVQQMHDCVCF